MASDKRPILSGKRARNRRKRAVLRASNRNSVTTTPECDSDEDPERKQQQQKREDSNSSAKTAGSQSEEEIDPGLVIVCRPVVPDFCSVFLPQHEDLMIKLTPCSADYKSFTMRIPTFQVTCEGYVTYTLEIMTCGEPRHTFQVERRFSEFVACAAEINTRLESNRAARCCTRLENEESKDEVFEPFKWELPAKTWFRVTQKNALEERRAQLESSMETLLLQDDRRICRLPVLRDFLMLDIFGVQVTEQKNFEAAQPFE
ncbi:putative Phox domain, PX domain superfamily protein [Plasmopara halstedii]